MQKISVSCAIFCDNSFLLVKEKQGEHSNWDIPAGGLDEGEKIEDAVRREVKEETGISIENPVLKKIYKFSEGNLDSINFMFLYALREKIHIFNPISKEIETVAWFDREEIEYLLNNKKYEHELARRRFKDLLLGFPEKLSFEEL